MSSFAHRPGIWIAAWCLAMAPASLAASVLAMGTLLNGISNWTTILYFPGDPPYLDIAFFPALYGLLLTGLLWFVQKLLSSKVPTTPIIRILSATAPALATLVFAICAGGLAFRFTPAWAEVRGGIRYYGDQIAAEAGDKKHVLTEGEFMRLKAKYVPEPVAVRLRGYGVVHLRMAHGVYPYVGVDFGDGANALFDPRWMICTYSD